MRSSERGDEQQLDDATRKLSAREAQERKDLIAKVMSRPGVASAGGCSRSAASTQRRSLASSRCRWHFNEGGRNIGLWMTDRLTRLVPQLYIQMRDEAARENW
jgi:hypothetical protein